MNMYIGGTCTLLLSTFVRKPSDVPKTARHNSIAEPSSLTYSPYSDCLTLVWNLSDAQIDSRRAFRASVKGVYATRCAIHLHGIPLEGVAWFICPEILSQHQGVWAYTYVCDNDNARTHIRRFIRPTVLRKTSGPYSYHTHGFLLASIVRIIWLCCCAL